MKKLLILSLVLLTACGQKPQKSIHISVDKATSSLKVAGVQIDALQGISHDTLNLAAWQSFFPVCKMPADTEMRNYQEPMKGKYMVKNNLIVFTPDTPLRAGQTYFARYYIYNDKAGAADIALHNTTPADAPYTELIFRY